MKSLTIPICKRLNEIGYKITPEQLDSISVIPKNIKQGDFSFHIKQLEKFKR